MEKISNTLQVIFDETKIPITEDNIRKIAEAIKKDFDTKEQLLDVASRIASGVIANPDSIIDDEMTSRRSILLAKTLIYKIKST